jgi:hypothetical protein
MESSNFVNPSDRTDFRKVNHDLFEITILFQLLFDEFEIFIQGLF